MLGFGNKEVNTLPRSQAWEVMLGDTCIDTVFYDPDCSADYVRDGLIDHDGYPVGIEVRKA